MIFIFFSSESVWIFLLATLQNVLMIPQEKYLQQTFLLLSCELFSFELDDPQVSSAHHAGSVGILFIPLLQSKQNAL